MDQLLVLLAIAAGAYFLIGPGLGIAAFTRTQRGDDTLSLRAAIARLEREIAELRRQLGLAPPAPPSPAAPPTPMPVSPEPAPQAEPPAAEPSMAGPWARIDTPKAARPKTDWRALEESLTSRWLVWVGGATLGLGAVFLVKYSIDHGWVLPWVRIALGILLGLALAAGGEALRRRPLERELANVRPMTVPPALTAAGLFALFASVYAGYALYALFPPLAAFLLLAAIAVGAVGLALLHGPFVALLGLLGGYLTPMLVSTGNPSAWTLFPYLLVVTAGSLGVLRLIGRPWLGWTSLAGAALWPLLWFAFAWHAADTLPVGLYLLATLAAFLLLHPPAGPAAPAPWLPAGLRDLDPAGRVRAGAVLAFAFLVYALVRWDRYGATSLVFAGLLAAALLVLARREAALDLAAAVAGTLSAALVATWHLPAWISERAPIYSVMGETQGLISGPIVPPELSEFVIVAGAFAALIGGGGFVALWGAPRPGRFAWVSAATPVALLAAGYWRILDFGLDLRWALVAAALAALSLVAAERAYRYMGRDGLEEAVGAYAAAALAALALGAAMALQTAWLTVALALPLPALAWLDARLRLASLRRLALILAGIVLARLVLNPQILTYPLGKLPLLNWVLYGYGVPALAFAWAARQFRARQDDRLVAILEAGALALTLLLVGLELRILAEGDLATARYRLLEQSLQAITWTAAAYGLMRSERRLRRPVLYWGARILLGLATAQVVGLHVLIASPLVTGDAVGSLPLLDLLLIAYLVPAGFALLFAGEFRARNQVGLARIAAGLAYGLVFVWLTLEVRRLFVGPVLDQAPVGEGELYAYSVAWLGYAGIVLGLGVWRGVAALRGAGLALLMLTLAKVFLIDMSALAGLWRVASFIGLGLALVGVGYLYQRLVFPPKAPGLTPAQP